MAIDDFAGNVTTTGRLRIGGKVAGRVEGAADADWFATNMVEGVLYEIVATSPSGTPLQIGVYDDRGIRYSLGSNSGPIHVVAQENDLFLGVGATDGKAATDYTLSLTALPDAHPANRGSLGAVVLGGSVGGRLEVAEDKDWFRVVLDPAKAYSFTATSTGAAPTIKVNRPEWPYALDARAAFRPPAANEYFIEVSGAAGDYTLSAAVLSDDIPDTAAGARPLALNTAFNGRLDHMRDADWFAVQLADGEKIRVTLDTRSDSGQPGSDMVQADYQIFPPAGGSISVNRGEYVAIGGGVHLIRIAQGEYADDFSPVRFSLNVQTVRNGDEHGDNPQAATPMQAGLNYAGALQNDSDKDVFKLRMEAGISYVLEVEGDSWSGLASDTRLRFDLDGPAEATPSIQTRADGLLAVTPVASGDHYLSLYAETDPAGRYSIRFRAAENDVPGNASSSAKLAIGDSASGTLDAARDDVDWFGVDLKAGMNYRFSAKPSLDAGAEGSVLAIVDPAGKTTAATPLAAEPMLKYLPQVSGTHYLAIRSGNGSAGGYTVSAAFGQPDDAGDSLASAKPVAPGASIAGKFELAGDIDTYSVELVKNTTYRFSVEGIVNGAAVALDNLNSNVVLDGPGAQHWRLDQPYFKATETATYYLQLRASGAWASNDYRIAYALAEQDQVGDDLAGAAELALGSAQAGKIELPGDKDYFRANVNADGRYEIRLDGPAGANFVVYDAYGAWKAGARVEAGSVNLNFVPDTTGAVYVAVSASDPGSYSLRVNGAPGTDSLAPTLTGQFPSPGNRTWEIDGEISLTFSEAINLDRGKFLLTDASGAGVEFDIRPPAPGASPLRIAPRDDLKPGETYTLALAPGAITDLSGNAYVGPSQFSFRTLTVGKGGPGQDSFRAFGVGDTIDGGAGLDAVFYADSRSAYKIVSTADATLVSLNGAAGSDVLRGVERLHFVDGALALDSGGSGGQAYRLYRAAFDRSPDEDGVGYWIAQLDAGMSLSTMARAFLDSEEFKLKYGATPSDADFVKLLYANVLHRSAEQAGDDFWVVRGIGFSREELLVQFSESTENKAAVLEIIGNGFAYTPFG